MRAAATGVFHVARLSRGIKLPIAAPGYTVHLPPRPPPKPPTPQTDRHRGALLLPLHPPRGHHAAAHGRHGLVPAQLQCAAGPPDGGAVADWEPGGAGAPLDGRGGPWGWDPDVQHWVGCGVGCLDWVGGCWGCRQSVVRVCMRVSAGASVLTQAIPFHHPHPHTLTPSHPHTLTHTHPRARRSYACYLPAVHIAGLTPHFIPLSDSDRFLPDFETISPDAAARCKALLLNYPNNPTSAVADDAFWGRALAFCERHDLL